MYFDSTIFLFLILPLIVGIYFLIGKRFRNLYLFVLNILIYACGEPFFVFLLLASMTINYFIGYGIDKNNENKSKAKTLLILGIIFNLLILVFFKYFMSLNKLINNLLNIFTNKNYKLIKIALPLGISFYTFQAISYIVDIYNNKVKVQKNYIKFGLYFSFFAQIVAGPIVRYKDIESQLDDRNITLDSFADGLKQFLIGLLQKILFANYFSRIANIVFETNPNTLGGATAWIGIIFYALQIYFDFAGYSSMAIGLAKMFGFDFKKNFDYPYISCSIKEFWRRWHISLSSWFRDYVYIPMGGNKKGKARMYLALFVVFVLSGLWHGSSLTFLVWGAYHGLFIIIEKLPPIEKILNKIPKLLRHIGTMLVVLIGWVFFRSPNIIYAFNYIGSLLFIHGFNTNMPPVSIFVIILFVFGVVASTPILTYIKNKVYVTDNKTLINTLLLIGYTLLILCFIACIPVILSGTTSPFIYAQF